jgi:hypothetical protein
VTATWKYKLTVEFCWHLIKPALHMPTILLFNMPEIQTAECGKCTPDNFFVQLPCTLGVRNVAKHLKLEEGGVGGFYLKFELQY